MDPPAFEGKGKLAMFTRPLARFVAIDGGTTNTRARLLVDGRVVGRVRKSLGVRDAVLAGAQKDALAATVRAAIHEAAALGDGAAPDLVVAAGMLTSERGLAQVDHVPAPADVRDLAEGCRLLTVPEAWDTAILFVPGVKTGPGDGPEGWMAADVMRGEECETFGAIAQRGLKGPLALLWPGSHTKLVSVDQHSRITGSVTTLAGEMFAALSQHTLLRASLPDEPPDAHDPSIIEHAAAIVAREGLGRAAFLVRVATLLNAMSREDRASFLLGAVVADDAENLARNHRLAGNIPLYIGGKQPLRALYADQLARRRSGLVEALDEETCENASALGALAVAQAFIGSRNASQE
jgi:2-dehydro-3-deoxygalactonokinase